MLRLLLIVALLATSVRAEMPQPLSTLDETRAWQAVGRLNVGDRGLCTGTLIAPRLVLTAAHCIFEKTTGARIYPDQIEFRAAWRAGRAAAYRNARRVVIHPDYAYNGPESIEKVDRDLALIELANPIRQTEIMPFETAGHVGKGSGLQVVSYGKDRAETLSIEKACQVLARDGGLYITSCHVVEGSSGAPVFVQRGDVSEIIAVVSAKAEWQGTPVALATGVENTLSELLDIYDRTTIDLHGASGAITFTQP